LTGLSTPVVRWLLYDQLGRHFARGLLAPCVIVALDKAREIRDLGYPVWIENVCVPSSSAICSYASQRPHRLRGGKSVEW
jgi:hypothetical protein